MKTIEAMITDITATTAEAEDYRRGRALYCGKCHTPKEAYFAEERPVSGVTATQQTATASGSLKSSKPPKADRSTLKSGGLETPGLYRPCYAELDI